MASHLLGDAYRAQIGPAWSAWTRSCPTSPATPGPGTPQPASPAWPTYLGLESGGRSTGAELLAALTVQALTVRATQSTATTPAAIIAGPAEVARGHLEAPAGACERRGVPLTLLFRHLRDDATALIGGAVLPWSRDRSVIATISDRVRMLRSGQGARIAAPELI